MNLRLGRGRRSNLESSRKEKKNRIENNIAFVDRPQDVQKTLGEAYQKGVHKARVFARKHPG